MPNEIVLIISLIVYYCATLLMYKIFGRGGLYAWIAFALCMGNIETMILIHAFGADMALGNVIISTTFLCTNILSEKYGSTEGKKPVFIGSSVNIMYAVICVIWMFYVPAPADISTGYIQILFARGPRIVIAGIVTFTVVMLVDSFIYNLMKKRMDQSGKTGKIHLFIRNNTAMIVAEVFDVFIFSFIAFGGVYPIKTIFSSILVAFITFIITTIISNPVLLLAKKMEPFDWNKLKIKFIDK